MVYFLIIYLQKSETILAFSLKIIISSEYLVTESVCRPGNEKSHIQIDLPTNFHWNK